MSQVRQVFILPRMRYYRLVEDPEVYEEFPDAKKAFEEHTRISWDDSQALFEELGGDPAEILGGPYAGTRLLVVEIPDSSCSGGPP